MKVSYRLLLLALFIPLITVAQQGTVQHIQPTTHNKPRGYSHVVTATGNTKTVYVAGQVSQDSLGTVVGKGDLKAQCVQVFKNLRNALAAGGASMHHVVKWTIYMTDVRQIEIVREARVREWPKDYPPPASTLVGVAALASPDYLIEIEAIAVVPQ